MSLKINGSEINQEDRRLVDELIILIRQGFDLSIKKTVLEAQIALRTMKPGQSKTFTSPPFEITVENTTEDVVPLGTKEANPEVVEK